MKMHEKILNHRKQTGWTQAVLAETAGTSTAHLNRLENGRASPSAELLYRISKALNTSMDYLMDDTADEPVAVSIKDKSLLETLQLVDQLGKEDKKIITVMIEKLLTLHRMENLIKQKSR